MLINEQINHFNIVLSGILIILYFVFSFFFFFFFFLLLLFVSISPAEFQWNVHFILCSYKIVYSVLFVFSDFILGLGPKSEINNKIKIAQSIKIWTVRKRTFGRAPSEDSACAFAQSDQNLQWSHLDIQECGCAVDLSLRRAHILEGKFSHVNAHIFSWYNHNVVVLGHA